MAENMDWAEIKMRLRDGASVQVLADLNAVTYKTMYNRIMAHQVKDGVEYLTPRNTKGMRKSKAISKTKQAQAKAKEKKAAQKSAERPEVIPEFLTKKLHIPEEIKNADMVTIKGVRVEGARDIPEEVYNMRRQLQPETIEELKEQYRTCMQLAERYQKQAEDWKKIIDTFGTSHPGTQGLPEV